MKKWIRFLSCVRTSPFSKGKENKSLSIAAFPENPQESPHQSVCRAATCQDSSEWLSRSTPIYLAR